MHHVNSIYEKLAKTTNTRYTISENNILPLFLQKGAGMRFRVKDNCVGCGMCVVRCPQVFSLTVQGFSKAIEGDIPPEAETTAIDAMIGCPMGAIEPVL